MTVAGWVQIVVFIAVVTALTPLLGGYMARVYQGQPVVLSAVILPVERAAYRILRVRPSEEQDWKAYACSLLVFSFASLGTLRTDTPTFVIFVIGFVIIFALLNFLAALFIGPLDPALTSHLYP
jgi:K+-transporting ATPase A subunit